MMQQGADLAAAARANAKKQGKPGSNPSPSPSPSPSSSPSPSPSPTPSSAGYAGAALKGPTKALVAGTQQRADQLKREGVEAKLETLPERTEQATKGVSARTGVGAVSQEGKPDRKDFKSDAEYAAAAKVYRHRQMIEAEKAAAKKPVGKKSSMMRRSMSGRRA